VSYRVILAAVKMAHLFKQNKSPFHYISYTDSNGIRQRHATRFYRDRKAWEKVIEKKMRLGEAKKQVIFNVRWKKEQTNAELYRLEVTSNEKRSSISGGKAAHWDQWVPNFVRRRWTHKKTHNETIRMWMFFYGEVLIPQDIEHPAELTAEAWDICVDEWQKLKPNTGVATFNNNFGKLRTIMHEAVKRQYCSINPLIDYRLRGRTRKRIRYPFDDHELDLIWAELNAPSRSPRGYLSNPSKPPAKASIPWPRWMTISFALGIYHGARIQATRMHAHQINLRTGMVVFMEKGYANHEVPICPLATPYFEEIINNGSNALDVSENSMTSNFSTLFKSIGLGQHSFHDTRRTCITRMALAGIPEQLARRYVNHASSLVHDIYIKIKPDEIVKVAQGLKAAFGGTHLPLGNQGSLPAIQEGDPIGKFLPEKSPSPS